MLGRHPDCAIRLSDTGVALQHAVLEDQPDGGVRIRRLAAEAVLRVNQREVSEADLQNGDIIEVGPHQFEFQSGRATMTGVGLVKRKLGVMQQLTLLAVGVLLLGQLAFLFAVSIWRYGQPPSGAPHKAAVSVATNPPPALTNLVQMASLAVPPPPPATVTPAMPTNQPVASEPPALSNEIQQIRQEIVQLHRDVAALPKPVPMTNATPVAAPSNAVVAAVEADDLILIQAQRMLKKTLAQAAQLDPEALDAQLETIQNMAPDFLPPYIERAQLAARRGLTSSALEQWGQIQQVAKVAELRQRAAEEMARLKQMIREPPPEKAVSDSVPLAPPIVVPPAPRAKPVSATHPLISLAQVEQQKFMTGENYDEMRVLRIIAAPLANLTAFNPAEVEVLVTFFDRDEKNGHIAPSRAVVPGSALHAPPATAAGMPLEFNATYQVPRGFWRHEEQRSGNKWRYLGYRVQLLYHGEIHDQREQPAGLLPAD